MTRTRLERLLWLVARTEDAELGCTACFEDLPRFVDLDVADDAPGVRLPLVRAHLEQCDVCREEYESLRELVHLDAEVSHPRSDQ